MNDYTSIYVKGAKMVNGKRDPLLRLNAIPLDFQEKTVLDLGCNCGGMLYAIADKISMGYGYDISNSAITTAQKHQSQYKIKNLNFQLADLSRYDQYEFPKVDIVFMLSIARWVPTWADLLIHLHPQTLVFEAHGDPKTSEQQVNFLKTRYVNVKHLLDSNEGLFRSLYLCTEPKSEMHPLQAQCGTFLGEGVYRRVYAHKTDPTLVIKVHKAQSKSNHNQIEFDNWKRLSEYKEQEQWLAPCVEISDCGKYLVQKKGVPILYKDVPYIPLWMRTLDYNNVKHSQFVMWEGRPRYCDYGKNLIELIKPLFGQRLYVGKNRTVYAHKTDPTLIIKVENKKPLVPGKNIAEYEQWLKLKDTEFGKYLAPCVGLYDSGRYLLQRRGEQIIITFPDSKENIN